MSELQPVTLEYEGREYTVSTDDGIWGLIEAIEDVITFFEILPSFSSGKFPTAKIFRAYTAALNYAGAKVTPNDVRKSCDYKQMGEYAGALAMVLSMAQPGADINLGEAKASESEIEETKKKVES